MSRNKMPQRRPRSNPGSKPAGRQRINDFELATRLAQFFWSSIPDDTLLELAEAGKLSKPQVQGPTNTLGRTDLYF